LLAIFNIGLSFAQVNKPLTDSICRHLNFLYTADFTIQLVNLFSYYHVHDIAYVSDRYRNSMISFAVTSILLTFMINEEKYAPAETIIADTVRMDGFVIRE
jgi:hypothetical protein